MPQRAEVSVSDQEREALERWARRPNSAQALALRCRIVLAAADGEASQEIAARLGCGTNTVGKWRGRGGGGGADRLCVQARPGQSTPRCRDGGERATVQEN